MNPRLIAIAGPWKGKIIPLAKEEASLGRGSSNWLCIESPSVSRRHCQIQRKADQFKISDLESLNGTFVNGLPVKQRALEHGDQITIGNSTFLFLLEEGEAPAVPRQIQPEVAHSESPLSREEEEPATSSRVQFGSGNFVSRTTTRLRTQDALYLRPDKLLETLPPAARMAHDLKALLRIGTVLSSIRGLQALEQQLLEMIFEIVPAERGAILLVGKNPDEILSVFGRDRLSRPDRPVQISQAIIDQVLREGVGFVSNNIPQSESMASAATPIEPPIHSVLAVPLVVFKKVCGVLYLDTSDPTVRFDEDHLELFTAIGGMAAMALDNARRVEWLEAENRRLRSEIDIEHNMVGESRRMRKVYEFIAKVAPTDSTVMICGESGTGKELMARGIHQSSPRANKPFVAINCAALTESLLESELFGHEKGAFTGAIMQKKGKLEVAQAGTVFLDEIGDLAPMLQAKLLRVLQEHEFERVGGTTPIKVDIRLIAATNCDLQQQVKNGKFREDLFFRLNVVSLEMPPLRERREDIPLLASYFLARYTSQTMRHVSGISREARACLTRYDWPGNVRELENAIERAVVLGSSDLILPEDLPEAVLETESRKSAAIAQYHEAINETKRQLIIKAVQQAGGNYTEAAKLLGIHPNYLHRLIRNLNLKAELRKS